MDVSALPGRMRRRVSRQLRSAPGQIAPAAGLGPRVLGELVRHLGDRDLERRLGTPLVERLVFSAMAGGYDPGVSDGFQGTLAFELTRPVTGGKGSQWLIDVDAGEAHARSGGGHGSNGSDGSDGSDGGDGGDGIDDVAGAALSVRLPVADFMRIAGGVIDPVEPILSGRASVRGDLGLASRLAEMFGAPRPR